MLGVCAEIQGTHYPLTVRKTDRGESGVGFDLGIIYVGVDLRHRRITGFRDILSLYGDWDLDRALTHERQIELTTELYRLAGHTDTIVFYERFAEKFMGDTPEFLVGFLRATPSGIPYLDHWVQFRFEHITGRLSHFSADVDPLPELPSTLTPAVPLSSARAAIIGRVFAKYRGVTELFDGREVRLGIWVPNVAPGAYKFLDLSSSQIQMASQNRGILVYWGTFWTHPDPKESTAAFTGWVDARTGRLLAADDTYGGGYGPPPRKLAPFFWSLGPQKFLLFAGKKLATVDRGLVSEAKAPTKNEQGKPVVVQVGRLYLSARFLPSSGLVMAERGGAKTYGKPNAALLAALRKICP